MLFLCINSRVKRFLKMASFYYCFIEVFTPIIPFVHKTFLNTEGGRLQIVLFCILSTALVLLLFGLGFSAWRKYRIDCSSGYAPVNIVHTTFTSGLACALSAP